MSNMIVGVDDSSAARGLNVRLDPCRHCRRRVKDRDGSVPVCAFDGAAFTSINWRCATMDVLRRASRLFGKGCVARSSIHWAAVLAVPEPTGDIRPGVLLTHVVLQWFRDQVRSLRALDSDGRASPVSRIEAEALADYYLPLVEGSSRPTVDSFVVPADGRSDED